MTRPPAGRFLTPAVAFFLLLLPLLLLLFRERGFYDPGSLWHVRVGEIVLADGFPRTDPFTYTFAGATWIPQQWGAEVLMALAHGLAGFDALLLGFSAGIAGLYAWIFGRATRSGMSPILAAAAVGGFLAAGAFHYFVRPHMFTIALLAWTMACLVDFERGRVGPWRLAGLIPLFVVWTNLHGGVLGGTMTLGLAVAGWIVMALPRLVAKDSPATRDDPPSMPSRRMALLLMAVVAACSLTPLVNPFGTEMIRTWQRIVGSEVLKEVVSEHKPLSLENDPDKVMLAVGLAYLALLAGVLPRRPRVTWLLPLVWFGLTFQSIRQGPLFAITAVLAIVDFWPETVWYRLLEKYGDTLAAEPLPEAEWPRFGWRPLALSLAAVAAVLALQVARVPVPVVGSGWARLDPKMTPVDLNAVVRGYAASVPAGTPIFNDANLGGYLIYFAPRLKIFMDDRCELYGDEWIGNYANAMGQVPEVLGPAFEGWHRRYGFDRAIVMTAPEGKEKPRIEQYLSSVPNLWREIARGECAVLYERVK